MITQWFETFFGVLLGDGILFTVSIASLIVAVVMAVRRLERQ